MDCSPVQAERGPAVAVRRAEATRPPAEMQAAGTPEVVEPGRLEAASLKSEQGLILWGAALLEHTFNGNGNPTPAERPRL